MGVNGDERTGGDAALAFPASNKHHRVTRKTNKKVHEGQGDNKKDHNSSKKKSEEDKEGSNHYYPFPNTIETTSCNGKNYAYGHLCDEDADCISNKCDDDGRCGCKVCDFPACSGCGPANCCYARTDATMTTFCAEIIRDGPVLSFPNLAKNNPDSAEGEEYECQDNSDCECRCCLDLEPHRKVCGLPINPFIHCMGSWEMSECPSLGS